MSQFISEPIMTYVNQKEGQSRLTKTSCFHTIALIARNNTLFIKIEKKNICTHPVISTTLVRNSLKALLHLAISLATCLAILLRHKLHEILPSVTYPATDICRNFSVAAIVAKSRSQFYFPQRVSRHCKEFFPRCTV